MNIDHTTETLTPDTTGMITIGGTQGLEIPVGTTGQRPVNSAFTGSISGNVLTVTAVSSGTVTPGQVVVGGTTAANTAIYANGTGSGSTGTYLVDISQTVASTSMTGQGLVAGTIRFNSTTVGLEIYNGSAWITGGGVSSVALAAPSIFTVSGSPVTSSGTLTLTFANQAANTVLAGPSTGAATAPTFRTLGLAQNDLNDVLITSATNGQVLSYNGTSNLWVNTGAAAGSYTTLVSSWTNPSGSGAYGSDYSAVVTHSLGTQNVIVQCYNATTNALVQLDAIVATSAAAITIYVNAVPGYSIRVVVIANGQSIAAGGSTPSSIIVQNNGVALSGTYTAINLVGVLSASGAAGVATISDNSNVIRALTYFATSFDSPNNTDWTVNALAPTIADPTYGAIDVRQFSNTIEQGVGLFVPVPSNATNISLVYKGRPQTAPGATASLQLRAYVRTIAAATAVTVGSWTTAFNLTTVSVPTNAFFQTYTYTVPLATLGLVAGNMYQLEITRNVGVAGNLASNWLLVEFDVTFT